MTTKKAKKFIGILILLTMLLGLLPLTASASGTTGDVSWSLDADGVFTVSGTGAMNDYFSADDVPWKDFRDSITAVVIGEGVTRVSDYGFYGCTNITSVTFKNDRLYRIGEYSFYNTESLKTVSIPEGTREIGYNAFGCDEPGKGLDTAYIYARNAELSFYYEEDNTFPAHTTVYGYECSRTEAQYHCMKYGRTFVALEDGCVVDIKKGEDCAYDFDDDAQVADLWKASKAENGSSDSIMLDYTFTLDASEITGVHNYMVDSESRMLVPDGTNDGRLEIEISLDLGERSIYKNIYYNYCPTNLDGEENKAYGKWYIYPGDNPLVNISSQGDVVDISIRKSLKDACEEYGIENPDYTSIHIRITGITSYKKYQYGKYYTYDNETQIGFHYMSLYDAHSREIWVEDVGPRTIDRAIYVTDVAPYPAPDKSGHYEPVKREYVWEYDFSRYCSDYDYENMDRAPGDGGDDMDVFVEEYKGVLYGHARGTYNAGSDNSMRLSDFITEENTEFIQSLMGDSSWGVQIMAFCTLTLTYADGSTLVLAERGMSEGSYIVVPCMHACTYCGLCTVTDKQLPCNFDSNSYMSVVCYCEEPTVETVETEVVEDVVIDTENSMVYCEPTVVVEKIDIEQSADTNYVRHITRDLDSEKTLLVLNIDLFDGEIPYKLNQWGGEEEILTITVPVGKENAQAVKEGKVLLYHIANTGKPELVEIDLENGIDTENGTITFSSRSFSPFALVKASEETTLEVQYNDNACTAQLGLTVADLEKEPVVCIAFYDNSGALVSTKIQKIKTLADKYTISCPQGSASCKVMLWTQNLAPVCEEAVCEY